MADTHCTCVVPAASMVGGPTLTSVAISRMLVGLGVGAVGGIVLFVLIKYGTLGWIGRTLIGKATVAELAPAIACAIAVAWTAALAMARDRVIDEAIRWSRRVRSATGVMLGPIPPDSESIRAWSPAWSLVLALPLGIGPLVVQTVRHCAQQRRTLKAWPRQQRRHFCRRADELLDGFVAAIDGTTLASPSGTYFGVLTHPVPFRERSAWVESRLFAGLGRSVGIGLVWCGTLLGLSPWGWWWLPVIVVHFACAVLLWWLGVSNVRVAVAVSWQQQVQDLRHTLQPARSERELVTRLIENSTYTESGLHLDQQFFLGWAQPIGHRPEHPLRISPDGHLSCAMPVFIAPSVLNAHTYISGSSESRKTSSALAGLLSCVLAGASDPIRNPDGSIRRGMDGRPVTRRLPMGPVLICDLKGDLFFRAFTKDWCKRLGRKYQELVIEPGAKSSYFNPIKHLHLDQEVLEIADAVLASHALYHGPGYGPGYFSSMNRFLLLNAYQLGAGKSRDYRELVEQIREHFDPRYHNSAMEAFATLAALGTYPLLNAAPPGEDEIDWDDVIACDGVVYAWLPLSVMAFLPRDVLRLLLFTFHSAVRRHNVWSPDKFRRAHVFLDECQSLASLNVESLLQQARSAGVNMVLANQSLHDLNSHGNPRLSHIVETNTRLKIHFTLPTEDDRQRAVRLSNERLGYLVGSSHTTSTSSGPNGDTTSASTTTSYQPHIHPGLNVNDILHTNNVPGLALVELSPDADTTRMGGVPTPIYIPPAVSLSEYERLARVPLERATQRRPVVAAPDALPAASPQDVAPQVYARLEEVYRQLTGGSIPTRKPT